MQLRPRYPCWVNVSWAADGVFHLTRAAARPSTTSERDCGRWGDIGQTGPFTMDGAQALTLTLSLRERGSVARTVGNGE
jgi:hypothetical protein